MVDGTELAMLDEGGTRAVAGRSESGNIVAMLLEAARDPAIDAAKVETMANLAMRMQDREQQSQFNRDFNAAIMDMPVITKAGIITIPAKDGNPERTQGRFARFEDIDRVVRPILRRHNLAIRFEVGEVRDVVTVRPIISHANGHTERGEAMRVPLDTSGSKNNTQGAGSSVTYGKRYSMCAFLNIVTEGTDDDGSLGKYAIEMPHEREVTVLEQAEDAAANENYQTWFGTQSPKDRAWLISSGHHARLGGAPALPDASRASQSGDRRTSPETRQDPPRRTARAWTEDYERLCEGAASLDELMSVQSDAADDIGRLKAANPALHQRAVDAGTKAAARLAGGDL